MRAFVFPGQGSQTVGMGRSLWEASAAARDVFGEVDEALGQNLSRLIFEGPGEDLVLTTNAQPALMTVSMAVMRTLEKEGGVDLVKTAGYVAGHSLGEYSALCAAGALSLADTARLLRQRGEAMQQAVPVAIGAMAALLGLDLAAVQAIAAEAAGSEVCTVANDNAPGQIVVSGHRAAVERAMALATQAGAKRAILLPVSAPFHCPLMQPAAEVMEAALAEVTIHTPKVPVMANVTATPVANAVVIARLLVRQVTGMVRWTESVRELKALGVTEIVELGAGKVLAGLVKRIDRELGITSIGTPDEVESFLAKV